MSRAYIADRVFTGTEWLQDSAVIVEDGIIQKIIDSASVSEDMEKIEYSDCFIAPAFIDLQIYGAYGKLLAVYPEADSLTRLREYCEAGGTAFCLPTVATNPISVVYKCIDAVKAYWEQGGDGVLGLHLEGPWINPIKRGAHISELIHSPQLAEVKDLLQYGNGIIKMITLAPEVCDREILELISSYNIVLSAGHSNATYSEAQSGFENGITAVTHLYNAMSSLQHREPGLVGAAMDHPSVYASIIPDGYHVDFSAIRIAKEILKERLFIITDSVTETNEGYYKHDLVGDKYEAGGILSGSALTMTKAVQNLVNKAGIDPGEALRMASLYPARVIKMTDTLGQVKAGLPANLGIMTNEFEVVSVVRN